MVLSTQPTLIVSKKGGAVMHITTLGIDVAKNVFQLTGWMREGERCSADA